MEHFAGFVFWIFAFTGLLLAITKYYRWMWTTLIASASIYVLSPCVIEIWLHLYARLRRKWHFEQQEHDEFLYNVHQGNYIPIIYCAGYNLNACGLEKFHPFDSQKYGKVFRLLVDKDVISTFDRDWKVYKPQPCERVYLMDTMSVSYLLGLHYSYLVCKVLEMQVYFLPAWLIRATVLQPMLRGTKGSIMAGKMAMEVGWAINLSGGYHHASADRGEGFCVYPDITLAIKYVRDFYSIDKVMIIDLDAHQGNGHARDHILDQKTFIVDCYHPEIFPGDTYAMQGID